MRSCADVNWVTVHAVFNKAEQEQRTQAAGWDPSSWEALFLGVDVERREQRADGSFTDWQPINPVSLWREPEYPEPQVDEGAVRAEDRQQVTLFKDMISKGESQLRLIRPQFPEIAYGDMWTYPRLPASMPDVLVMDCDYQQPDCRCRYPECDVAGGAGRSRSG